MKIQNINVYNFSTPFKEDNSAQFNQNKQFDYTNTLNPAEMLGRSQVNFTGNKFEQYDKEFLNVVSKNLRFTKEQSENLNNLVKVFLKEHDFNSLKDIVNDKDVQLDFLADISERFDLSDLDNEILADVLRDRLFYEDDYEPEVDIYRKDYEVVDHIMDKYGYAEAVKGELFDVMKMEAENRDFDNVFEIFKPENNPGRFMELMTKYVGIEEDSALDLMIDFTSAAKKDAQTRHSEVDARKYTRMENKEALDKAIASEIAGSFDLVDDKFCMNLDDVTKDDNEDNENQLRIDDILKQVARRYNGTSVEQIAFELTEKYNLPEGAYKFIVNTINEYDAEE